MHDRQWITVVTKLCNQWDMLATCYNQYQLTEYAWNDTPAADNSMP